MENNNNEEMETKDELKEEKRVDNLVKIVPNTIKNNTFDRSKYTKYYAKILFNK